MLALKSLIDRQTDRQTFMFIYFIIFNKVLTFLILWGGGISVNTHEVQLNSNVINIIDIWWFHGIDNSVFVEYFLTYIKYKTSKYMTTRRQYKPSMLSP